MKFSIITCTYNSEKYLKSNIESVESQNFQDFEHIFIDGFSCDDTIEIIKKYQTKYPEKVKLFRFEPNGIGNAMNSGIEVAKGRYIIHLHSDDSLFDENVLKDVSEFISKKQYPEMVYGKAFIKNIENNKTMIRPFLKIGNKKLRFWLLLLINYIPHQSVFLQKEVFEKYGGFDESLKNAMDHDLWLRLTKKKINAKYINRIICCFIIRHDSQTMDNKFNKDNIIIYKKYFNSKAMIRILTSVDKLNKFIVYKFMSITKV